MRPAPEPSAQAAYQAADRQARIRLSLAGCVLALVLMPAGLLLDWLAYPERLGAFALVRGLCDAGILAVWLLLRGPAGQRHPRLLGLAWAQLPAAAICVMIAATDGAASPYYLGLVLVMIAVALLMPWTLSEVVANCLLTLAGYLIASLLSPVPADPARLGLNLTFLGMVAAICATAGWFSARLRRDEFLLRWELDVRNRQLDDNYRRLEEADRLRSQFVANTSHELRTPLTLILAPLEDLLASGQRLPGQVAERIGLARDNALRLLKLINDLLELARLEMGGGGLHRRRLALEEFLPGLADQMRYLAENKGLELVAADGGALAVDADPARLEKVVLNLLTNAIKFTPAGGTVTVAWRREGGQALISVADTGVGIPAAEHERIFDRFHQVDGSSTRRYQGVGLGLALVRDLVQEHGGAITVASEPGSGSTFTVRLPLAAQPTGSAAEAGAGPVAGDGMERIYRLAERRGGLTVSEPGADALAPCGSGEAVLVVEDEPDMRRFLVALLRDQHRVLQAADGPSAIEVARRERPVAVLLDMMLPGMDGLEVCRRLREDPSLAGLRVIMLTARSDEETKLRALALGADDFLTKPFAAAEVRLRIGNLLRLAALQRDLAARNAELAAALERIKAAESQLVQSEKIGALGRMSAGLMHEISNPLNFTLAALGFASGRGAGDADLAEALSDMRTGLERIRTVVTDLKVFAHPSRGFDSRPFAIDEPIELAARLCARELEGIALVRELAPGGAVEGSCNQLSHVFVNLLANAARAIRDRGGPPGEVRIASRLDGGRLRVLVRDDGVGIPAEHLARICEPFFTTREPGQGLGLGLSICSSLVAAHGGRLQVRSEAGRFTEFSFDLTLASGSIAPDPHRLEASP